jgi:solute carrier family 9 (sodium/hydrogen exchanger), member 8
MRHSHRCHTLPRSRALTPPQHFFRNLGTIVLFAVFGTLMSTFIVGYLTYLAGCWGLINIDVTNPMEALLFGALISAVDTVATLSIIGSADLKCDPLLYR